MLKLKICGHLLRPHLKPDIYKFVLVQNKSRHMPSLSPLRDGTGLPEMCDEPPSLMDMMWTETWLSVLATDSA